VSDVVSRFREGIRSNGHPDALYLLDLLIAHASVASISDALQNLQLRADGVDGLYGLSPLERLMIWVYSDYSEFSVTLNSVLRAGLPYASDIARLAPLLASAIRKLPIYEGTVFRGLALPQQAQDDLIEHGRRRDVFPFFSFVSTSRTPERAFGGNVLLSILSRTGRSLQAYVADEAEQEILFLPQCQFMVLNWTFVGMRLSLLLEEVTE
jgi:hypothetical protein